MITNEVQYRSTLAHLCQFEQALHNLESRRPLGEHSKLVQLELDAVASQAEDLRAELAEYERLRSGDVSTLSADTLGELSLLLIQARVARGWTQRQLADALGVAEQQVQRYEANGYRQASLARICDVAEALHIDVAHVARLQDTTAA